MSQNRLDLSKLQDIKCPCGNGTFTQIFFLKRVPALMIGAPIDDAVPVPAFECKKCKNPLDLGKAIQKAAGNAQIELRKS
jgi:hypothetical protein